MMDLTVVATMLGVSASPQSSTNGNSDTGSGKPPSWWPGDDVAANDSIEAARQLGFVVGSVN